MKNWINEPVNNILHLSWENIKLIEKAISTTSKGVEKTLMPINSEKKISNVVERHAEYFYKKDQDFKGSTLEEYKIYMKNNLIMYVNLNRDINILGEYDMTTEEAMDFIFNIDEKYKNMFLRCFYESL